MTPEMKELYRVLIKHLAFLEECFECTDKDDIIYREKIKARRDEIEKVIDYIKR